MNNLLRVLLILLIVSPLYVFSDDEKPKKKSYEDFKKELKEKYKDAVTETLIDAAAKLEEYYKFKTAAAYRELANEQLTAKLKAIEESLKKIEALKPEEKHETSEEKTPENEKETENTETDKKLVKVTDPDLLRFAEISEKLLKNEQILTQCMYDRCKYWFDEDNKGKESTLIYVKAERKFMLSREKELNEYYEAINKYEEKEDFYKADQKRILLKNALSRMILFIDGKIKAYESTLKSIKRRKKLKGTSAQRKAEKRIAYYKWVKPFIKKITEVLKKREESETNIKYHEEMIFFYEIFEKYNKTIKYPEYLMLKDTEIKEAVKKAKVRVKYLKDKDKKNPEKESRDK